MVQSEHELDVNLNPRLREMNVVEIFEYFNTMSPVSQAQAMVITGLQKRFMADMTQVRLNLMM